jgi:hypothetical protein
MRSFDSIVLKTIAEKLPPYEEYDSAVWPVVINTTSVNEILKTSVAPEYARLYADRCRAERGTRGSAGPTTTLVGRARPDTRLKALRRAFEIQIEFESSMAGTLLFLTEHGLFTELQKLFYSTKTSSLEALELVKILQAIQAQDAYLNLDNLDPQDKEQIKNVALSPISVVHLFRQYFFELDTFLGSPVGHVWLSPGSTVELGPNGQTVFCRIRRTLRR